MEILDSFKFIVYTGRYNYTSKSSHGLCSLKRKDLRFNILSVIQWYTLIRFLYENSIKIPKQYTNYKTFYNNLSNSYFCLLKSKDSYDINNFIMRLCEKGHLKLGITYEKPSHLIYSNFDPYVKYLTLDYEYMTVKSLFNKFMDTCDYISTHAKDENDFISQYMGNNNDSSIFICINNDDNNIIESKMMLSLDGMSVIIHDGNNKRLYNGYNSKLSVDISNDTYFNTLLEEYTNHVLTHNAINNTMSKHIVYTNDTDVINQVLINNNKIIHEMQSKFTQCSDDNNLHRKQDLLDALRSLKIVDNKSNGTKITL